MTSLTAIAADLPTQPDRRHTLIDVILGDETLLAECSISGRSRPAVTQADPEYCHPAESPEVEILRLWLANPWRDVSGLLEDGWIFDRLQAHCDEWVYNHRDDGPDPDEERGR